MFWNLYFFCIEKVLNKLYTIIGDGMKKGFTLIEMLGIITVLAVVLLVTFPIVNNSLKQAKDSSINNSLHNVKISTGAYIELNRDMFPELNTVGGRAVIIISDLYNAGLLKGEQNGVELDDSIVVEVNNDNTFKYYFKGREI